LSKLSELKGESKKILLGKIEIEIRPLTVSSLPLLIEMGKEETQSKAIQEIIKKTLKDAVPDATDEEIENIGLEYMTTIMSTVMEVNKLEGDKLPPEIAKKFGK